ncbi:MAG: sulfide/dihydroorotate dehydrogenase-like FAD/NAD-binding protein [Candidatus Bathyarchaeota archaeon]|nr:sulfide/dihydroorotate dehydrogenase-like FAD/NAD-binding protein [Candidatus Bathyarchaeota archaeon]MDH5495385.1 sulfide/dihydroorotate dehydrogenase-like FAD/NAD-binding protein [Candidatus Bathyarchaeota archaeon]
MYKIVAMQTLAPQTKLAKIYAPEVAKKAQAGQFVILRVDEKGERIPLTFVDWEPENGTVTLIFQEVGVSTKKLGSLNVNEELYDVVGPLGQPSDIKNYGTVVIVGGGVGTAPCLPIAKAFKKAGSKVISIIGARNEKLLILEEEMRRMCDEVHISTDDGSKGHKGFVSEVLKMLIEKGCSIDIVYAIGPTVMMRAVAEVTRPYKIKTIVSLNPIMVDGMGMCGACRVSVGGKVKFACVDGPEFDGHQVDFNELIKRQRSFLTEEKLAIDHWEKCRGN